MSKTTISSTQTPGQYRVKVDGEHVGDVSKQADRWTGSTLKGPLPGAYRSRQLAADAVAAKAEQESAAADITDDAPAPSTEATEQETAVPSPTKTTSKRTASKRTTRKSTTGKRTASKSTTRKRTAPTATVHQLDRATRGSKIDKATAKRLLDAQRKSEAAKEAFDKSRAEFFEAMADARESGVPCSEIGRTIGMSIARVSQLSQRGAAASTG